MQNPTGTIGGSLEAALRRMMIGRPQVWRALRTVYHLALGALLALYVGFFVAKCVADIRFPYELDYGEGLMLAQALRLVRGESLYNDYTHYPFVVSNYPPIFVALVSVGVKLLGSSFAFGRALAVGCAIGVAIMMGVLLRRCGTGVVAAVGAPAFFLSNLFVTLWSGFMRVDSLALLLVLGGLYCVLRGGKWLLAAVLLMAAASYTKQSMIAGLAAGFVYLWWMGRRRNAVLFASSWAVIVLVAFALFQAVSRGWFYRHMVIANANPWQADLAWWFVQTTLQRWPVLFAIAGIAAGVVAAGAFRRRDGPPPVAAGVHGERLLLPYFIFAAGASLTVGKLGASVNHMIEPIIAALLLAGLGYDRLVSARPSRAAQGLWVAAAAALLGQAIAMWCPPSRFDQGRTDAAQGAKLAAKLIAQTKGDIIGEPVSLLVMNGRPLLLDPATFSCMYLAGFWDPAPLLRDINDQRFGLIFMNGQAHWGAPKHGLYGSRWSARIMEAIRARYRPIGSAGNVVFLAPAAAT